MTPTRSSLCAALYLASLIASSEAAQSAGAKDSATLRSHLVQYFTQGAPEADKIQRDIRLLKPDGSWPDIDYTCQQRGGWSTYRHVARVNEMARAYRASGHPQAGSKPLREAIEKALDHWLKQDYTNPNWWYGRIGVPRLVAPTLILMDGDLSEATRKQAVEQVLSRSTMGMTGQNKVWVAGIAFMKGLLSEDVALMQKARDAILSELRVSTAEGVQADFSFHQHGPQQQWGNYGASFGSDMIQWSAVFQDTDFAISPDQLDILRDYLLEGSAWIVWRGRMDVSGCGRQVFPRCQSSKGSSLLGQLRFMKRLDPIHAGLFDRVLDSQDAAGRNLLVGHKHYWRSDISVHRRPTWYASVKMSSPRVIGAETCNSENLLGLHLGDGVTYFHRAGTEYEDLFPVWNWRRLPGTTCRQDDGSLVPNSRRCRGKSDFVGGVSDAVRGLAAMEYRRDGLSVQKSWFFLEDCVVCLGAGITCDKPEDVVTSIDQSVLSGPVTVSEAGHIRELERGTCAIDSPDWLHHAGIGYRLLGSQRVDIECQKRQGDWRKVHNQNRGAEVDWDVFALSINHGGRPEADTYAYAVYPGATTDSMPRLHREPRVSVLQLTDSLQAVGAGSGSMILAAFFKPGRLSLPNGGFVEADQSCLVVLDRTVTPERLHVADPTHRATSILIRVATSPKTVREMRIPLPRGAFAGQTVSAPDPGQP